MSVHRGLVFPEVMENFHLLAQVFAAEPKEALNILSDDFNIKTATVHTAQENLSCFNGPAFYLLLMLEVRQKKKLK